MAKTLILVESPNKAKKIAEILGSDYYVRASMGHICDLPTDEYGVDTKTFEEKYVLRNAELVQQLRQLAKRHSRVLLATDPDREGEAIAWHLARELHLSPTAPLRIRFQEVTSRAIQEAVQHAQPIDLRKVDAARARRVLDRIVGFDVSQEICWPAGAQSAGRVQTPALHIICERERAIRSFVPRTYWTLSVDYAEGFTAFVPTTEPTESTDNADNEENDDQNSDRKARPRQFATREEAEDLLREARQHPHIVRDVAKETTYKRPDPPYTTSTLLQDASRKLRLSAAQAMDYAQMLFEAGYITYHRTDSTRVSEEAIAMARAYIATHNPDALPETPPRTRVKSGAQDAHEAIRPTKLEGDDSPPAGTDVLYAMIKARFLASQCKPARFEKTHIQIVSGPVEWLAEGSVLLDPGFLAFWHPYARQSDDLLPQLSANQVLNPTDYSVAEKQTTPPPRFDTGALIKALETCGVGRPSTYKLILQTLFKRGYIEEIKTARGKEVLQPTDFGLKVDELLTQAFPALVGPEYTAAMESALDQIEDGADLDRLSYLSGWHADFRAQMATAISSAEIFRNTHGLSARPRGGEPTNIPCDRCGKANYNKVARKSERGSFLACPVCNMKRNVRAKVRPGACKRCGSALIEKKGPDKSSFWGCVRFGANENPCNYTEREDGTPTGRYIRKPYHKKCPKCLKEDLVIFEPRDPAYGTAFYSCPGKSCGFKLDVGSLVRKKPCPECGYAVFERRRRPTPEQQRQGLPGTSFWACARYPECRFTSDMASRVSQSPISSETP